MLRNFFLFGVMALGLTACGAAEPVWAPDDLVERSIYKDPGPPSLTLFTVVNTENPGFGAHTGLMVSGSQRVIFDPAGSFSSPSIPERNDVIFGATPRLVDYYTDYHARRSFHVVAQKIEVSPEVAELALRLVQEYGAVPKGRCSISTTNILAQIPGFESVGKTWFPTALSRRFGRLPGVETWEIRDPDDPDDNTGVLIQVGNDPAFARG